MDNWYGHLINLSMLIGGPRLCWHVRHSGFFRNEPCYLNNTYTSTNKQKLIIAITQLRKVPRIELARRW